MSKSLQQKYQSIVSNEIIERSESFYMQLDDYFENEKKYGKYWECFNGKLSPYQVTTDSDDILKSWIDTGLIPVEGVSTYIDSLWVGLLIELDHWGLKLKSKLKIAEQLRKPYKHSQYGLFEFYACFADFGETPVEIIVTRDRRAVIGGFYELAGHKESIDFPAHISINLNYVIQKISQRQSNVKYNGTIRASKAEAKILSVVQDKNTNKIEVNFKKGEPVNISQTIIEKNTSVHEALNNSSDYGELRILKSQGKVSLIEHTKNIKL